MIPFLIFAFAFFAWKLFELVAEMRALRKDIQDLNRTIASLQILDAKSLFEDPPPDRTIKVIE